MKKIRDTISFWILTIKHKSLLLRYLTCFALKLIWRGIVHDYSKFTIFEGVSYGAVMPKFEKFKYGSPEYDALLEEFRPAIEHHYKYNRHHPQHFENGYTDMNLLDITEMFFDWKAASKKKSGTGSLAKSLPINIERFKMSEDISKILENSLEL